MKRALLLLLVSGCSISQLEAGRYSCQRDQADQCPGAWRCGLENFCHQLGDTSVAWKCEADSDCEAQYVCGLATDRQSRECHDPAAGRAWQCDVATDCTGGWQCGIAKSRDFRECHDPAAPRDWPCAEQADCSGGWVCGRSFTPDQRECHDPAAPRDWPCDVAADCSGGWVCGRSFTPDQRECHDPAGPRDWPCDVTADCSGGWVCGRSFTPDARECHDPAAPREWRCEVDADCVAGWRCGRSFTPDLRECHDPGAPRAWSCATDDDCLGGWRCAADALCVSPLADALEPGALPGIDAGYRINPLYPIEPLIHASVAPTYTTGLGRGKRSALFTQNGRLRSIVIDSLRNSVEQHDLASASDIVVVAAQGARGTHYEGAFDDVVNDDLERGYFGLSDGGAGFLFLDGDGGVQPFDVGVPLTRFEWGSTTDTFVPSLLAFSETAPIGSPWPWELMRIRGDGYIYFDELWGSYFDDFELVPGNQLFDATSLQKSDLLECTFVVDKRGLWVSQRGHDPDVTTWFYDPIHFGPFTNTACGGAAGEQFRSVSSLSDRWLAASTEPADGGQTHVTLFDAQRMWIDRNPSGSSQYYCTAFGDGCTAGNGIPLDVQFGPCTACPSGSSLKDMAVTSVAGAVAPAIEVRCEGADHTSRLLRLTALSQSSTQCVRELIVGTSTLFTEELYSMDQLAPGAIAFHGAAGQLWSGANVVDAISVTFDRAAFGVVRRSASAGDVIAFANGIVGTPTAIGLLSNTSRITAAVRNAASWAVSGSEVIDLTGGPTIAEALPVAAGATVFPSPTSAVTINTADAGRQLIVTAGNRIYAADVSGALDGGALGVITERGAVVSPIDSISFPFDAPPATGWASGYAITGGAVIRLVADSPTRWRSEPVDLPPALAPLAVWFQGARGRVGFQDGTVFSLPSRVAIAAPIPGGVVGFEQVCGQQLALGATGLFRLELDGTAPVGVWRSIELPDPFKSTNWDLGSIHAAGSELYLFTRTGEALGITFDSCP